jgi:hypothetical protein
MIKGILIQVSFIKDITASSTIGHAFDPGAKNSGVRYSLDLSLDTMLLKPRSREYLTPFVFCGWSYVMLALAAKNLVTSAKEIA